MSPLVLIVFATLARSAAAADNVLIAQLNIDREMKRRLGYVEDAFLNFTELAKKYGYPVEEHEVVSPDGYNIRVFRIPHGRRSTRVGPPVLTYHGITDSADTWIFPGPKRGLGYMIANAGYDLWCANFRGNKYSRRHLRLNPDTDEEYWKFSYDEMAAFDLPAVIDYILERRGLQSLSYIGFSQGTTIFFSMGAYTPEYYSKVNVMIALAPITYLTNSFNPYLRLITKSLKKAAAFFTAIGVQEMFANSSVVAQSFELLCQFGKVTRSMCSAVLFSVAGYDDDQLTDDLMPLIAGHTPCGVSLQNLVHLGQGFQSARFQRFDRGARENLKQYGTATPPAYNLSSVSAPVALFVGLNDWLSSPKDARRLRRSLPHVAEHYVVPRARWQHTDHLWAAEAPELVGRKIINILGKYSQR